MSMEFTFGMNAIIETKTQELPNSILAEEERLKLRKQRFQSSTLMENPDKFMNEEKNKISQRQQRFGKVTTNDAGNATAFDAKLQKRKERFGMTNSNSNLSNDNDGHILAFDQTLDNEKRIQRSARFGEVSNTEDKLNSRAQRFKKEFEIDVGDEVMNDREKKIINKRGGKKGRKVYKGKIRLDMALTDGMGRGQGRRIKNGNEEDTMQINSGNGRFRRMRRRGGNGIFRGRGNSFRGNNEMGRGGRQIREGRRLSFRSRQGEGREEREGREGRIGGMNQNMNNNDELRNKKKRRFRLRNNKKPIILLN